MADVKASITKIKKIAKAEIEDRRKFKSMEEFFPFYLKEHSNRTNRRLHVIGTLSALISLIVILLSGSFQYFFVPLVVGYGFAWVGHFFFEKNKPATFKHPFYSFAGDWKMLYQVLSGKIPF